MNKEYIKGVRKAKKIVLKYVYRTQDNYLKEIVKELNDLIKELRGD